MKIKDTLTESKIYIILVFIGISLLFYSIWEIRPIENIDVNSLGLLSYLTVTYWIGFILIISCSIVLYLDKKIKQDYVYIIYLIAIGLFLFGISIFTEENARVVWSYYPPGEVKVILQTGRVENIASYPLGSYHSWPGSHLISAFMIYLVNFTTDDILKYMPLFWVMIVIYVSYSIGKLLLLEKNQCFMISFFILSSFWTMAYGYGAQSLSYILYLLFFCAISLLYKRNTTENMIFVILTFAATIITHMLTSLMLITTFLFSSESVRLLYKDKIRTMIIILFLIIFIGWHMNVATSMFSIGVRDAARQITEGQVLNFLQSEKYSSGIILERQIVHYSRIIYLGIYIVATIMASIFYLKGWYDTKNKQIIKLSFLWLVGVLVFLAFRYGVEIDERVYIFSLLPMSLIIVMSLNQKIVIMLAILLIGLHIPAHYGTESYDMVYTSELQGSKFIASNINPLDSMAYINGRLIVYYNPHLFSKIKGVGGPRQKGVYDVDEKSLDIADYVVYSKQVRNYFVYIFGIDKILEWLQKDNKSNLLYNNGYFFLYKNGKD